jgi:hypothetical protein
MRIFNESDDNLVMNIFNNANNPGESVTETTGMSIHVDLVNHKATSLRNVSDADDPVYSVSQGNFQWVDPETAHTFLGYGSISKVKEFDAEGKNVLSAQFGYPNTVASYRGFKCPWKATPFWKPVVVANPTAGGADVHMSWNGATEYDTWAIYSAPSADSTDTTFISSHARTGFETKVTLSDLPSSFIQVVARQGNTDLGTSEIVSF